MSPGNGNLLPVSELARRFKYNSDYLTQLIRRGEVRGEKVGKFWHATYEEVAAFHERKEAEKRRRWEALSRERKQGRALDVERPSLAEAGGASENPQDARRIPIRAVPPSDAEPEPLPFKFPTRRLAALASVFAMLILVSFASAHPAEVGRILGYPSSLGLSYGNAVIEASQDRLSQMGEAARRAGARLAEATRGWEVTDTAVALIPSLPKLKTPHLPPRSIGARLAQMDLGGTFDLRIPHFDLSRWGDSLLSLLPRRGEMSRAKPRDREAALHLPRPNFSSLIPAEAPASTRFGEAGGIQFTLPRLSFSKTTRRLSEGWLSLQKDFSSRIAWLADDLTASVTRSYRTLASLPTRSQRPLSQPLSPTSLSLGEAGTPGERGFSSPSRPESGSSDPKSESERDRDRQGSGQIIERIVLRDIQIIEKAVPGPRGEPGKDGIAFVSPPPASSFPPTPAEAPASTRFGEAGGVHSPNEDLDSRLPLGHELEAEWRGNDNAGEVAGATNT